MFFGGKSKTGLNCHLLKFVRLQFLGNLALKNVNKIYFNLQNIWLACLEYRKLSCNDSVRFLSCGGIPGGLSSELTHPTIFRRLLENRYTAIALGN